MKGRLKCGSGTERDTRCGVRGSSEVGSGQGAAFGRIWALGRGGLIRDRAGVVGWRGGVRESGPLC